MKLLITDSLSHAEVFAAIGVILMVAEVFVPGFVLFPLGAAFLITAGCALFTTNLLVLLSVLAVSEIVLFFGFRKYAKKLVARPRICTNAEGMIGQECVVQEEIPKNGKGYVKLYGDVWQASGEMGAKFKVNERVVIVSVDGNKVVVSSIN